MKTGLDFVSNSGHSNSSCFIVIADHGKLCSTENLKHVSTKCMSYPIPNKDYGCKEFGWQNRVYSTLEDKLNWCGIILLELYAACRSAELKAGFIGDNVQKVCPKYEEMKEKYVKWKKMLETVCKEKLGTWIYINLDWINLFGGEDLDSYAYAGMFGCYIDHQSSIFENPNNGSMFESEDALYNFLAYEESYIQCRIEAGNH